MPWYFRQLWPSLLREIFFFPKTRPVSRTFVRTVWLRTTLPNFVFQLKSNFLKQAKKIIPVRSINSSLSFPKSSIHCSSVLAGVSYNGLVRLAELKKCHGRLPLIDVTMSTRVRVVSSCLWSIPSPRITIPISRELQLAPQKSFISFCSCGHHVDIFRVGRINVLRFFCPKGGILIFM